jgi:hypothetical protein
MNNRANYFTDGSRAIMDIHSLAHIFSSHTWYEASDSILGIATGWTTKGLMLSSGRVKNFLFSMSSWLALGSTQPPIQWAPGALSPGIKRPGREADHSPPASDEVKKMWIYISTPSYAFTA